MSGKIDIYLASPYSSNNREVRQLRYKYAVAATYLLTLSGFLVYSPIVSCHGMADAYDMPKDWDFWKENDETMLKLSEHLVILCAPGHEHSVGIKEEIKIAMKLHMGISYWYINNRCYDFVVVNRRVLPESRPTKSSLHNVFVSPQDLVRTERY